MADDLPTIEQEFIADVSRWIAGMEEMIQAGRDFIKNNAESIASVEALQAEIDHLDGKMIEIKTVFTNVGYPETQEQMDALDDRFEEAIALGDGLKSTLNALRSADATLGETMAESNDVIEEKSGRLNALQKAVRDVGLSEAELALLAERSGNAIFDQGSAADKKADQIRALSEAVDTLSGDEERNIFVVRDAERAARDAAAATAAAGNAAQQGGHQFRIWGTGITVGGYGLHWLIAGTSEFLAVFVPAMIAAGAAAGAMAEGIGWVKDTLTSTFTATEATTKMLHMTTGEVYGLKDSLQQAQTAADPHVYELLGAGVNAAKESFSNFWAQGGQVVDMLDRFAAHVDLALGKGGVLGGQAQGAIKNMVSDLQGLGQVLGNVGHILLSLATDMPGVAEVVLHAIAGITGILNDLFQNKFVGYGVTLFMFMEELGRWSGLLMNMFAPVASFIGGALGKLGVQMMDMETGFEGLDAAAATAGDALLTTGADAEIMGGEMATAGNMTKTFWGTFRMLLTTPVGWFLLAAAGIAALVVKLSSMKNAWESTFNTMTSSLYSAGPVQGLADVINTITALQNKMKAGGLTGWDAAISPVQLNALVITEANLLGMNTKVNGSYQSLADTMALATAAGVTVGQMFNKDGSLSAVAAQQIKNLIAGYQNMAQTGGILAADINAVNVQTLEQQTDVSKLNQAWDSFLSTVTGGTSSLAGLNTDLTTIGNVTTSATSKIAAFSQQSQGMNLSVGQISKALEGFSGTSAQVWQNYDSALTQAGTVTDWLRTAASEGALTSTQYAESIKGVVAELLPYTSHSATAVAQLDALAQEANGPATTSFQTLASWVGNTKDAQDKLNKTVQSATQYMSNLSGVAAQLSDTISSEVASALAAGSANFGAITKAAQEYNQQLHYGSMGSTGFTNSQIELIKQLRAAGQPINAIIGVMDVMAKRAGFSSGQILQMNKSIQQLIRTMAQVHSVSATVSVSEMINAPGGHIVGPGAVPGLATGGRIPGYGGGDRVPIMAEAGEAVVPKHLVAGVAPYLGAHGVPGFAKGGRVEETPMERVVAEWAGHIWKDYLHQFGKHGPIGLTKLKDIWGPNSFPKTGIWSNPQYRVLREDERRDMDPYYLKDILYNKVLGQIGGLKSSESSQIANWEYDRKHYGTPADVKYWSERYRDDISYDKYKISEYEKKLSGTTDAKLRADYTRDLSKYTADLSKYQADLSKENTYYSYAGDISRLEKTDAKKLEAYEAELRSVFRSMGYARGGLIPFGHYDSGGYLPLGLSMALNTTGRPESVGGGGGAGNAGDMHVHLHMDGREFGQVMIPGMVRETARYNIRNSGKVTGQLKPS